jgi:hypothetical protein
MMLLRIHQVAGNGFFTTTDCCYKIMRLLHLNLTPKISMQRIGLKWRNQLECDT